MLKAVLFQTIQFSLNTQFSCIWRIDRCLSGATIPSQIGLGTDGNEGVLGIPQSSSITRTLPLDCLASYQGHSLVRAYSSAPRLRSSRCIIQPPRRTNEISYEMTKKGLLEETESLLTAPRHNAKKIHYIESKTHYTEQNSLAIF